MVSHIFALQTGDSGHFLAFAAMLAEEVTSCLPGAKLAAVTREASTGTIYGDLKFQKSSQRPKFAGDVLGALSMSLGLCQCVLVDDRVWFGRKPLGALVLAAACSRQGGVP